MSDVIVHIGFNKCGITAIQHWLAGNIAALADSGFAYRRTDPRPEVICWNMQFTELAHSLAGQATPPHPGAVVLGYRSGDLDAQNRLATAFSSDYSAWASQNGKTTTLISNESLASWLTTPALIRALDGWLRARFAQVRYLAYVRQPGPWLVSLYGHEKRNGLMPLDLDAFIVRHRAANFGRHLKTWAQAIGLDRLSVRLFHESWLKTDGLIRDFCDGIGLENPGIPRVAKQLNTLFASRKPLRHWLGLRRGPRLPARPVLTAAQHATINARNADDFQWIADSFFATRREDFRTWATAERAPG